MQRIAAQRIVLPNGTILRRHVVEIEDSRVVRHYPLCGEQPHTEWYNETLYVRDGKLLRLNSAQTTAVAIATFSDSTWQSL